MLNKGDRVRRRPDTGRESVFFPLPAVGEEAVVVAPTYLAMYLRDYCEVQVTSGEVVQIPISLLEVINENS